MNDIVKKHDQELMKQQNIKLVLSVIKDKGPISRAQISRIVDMSPTSVGRIVESLMLAGLVKEVGSAKSAKNGIGRKANLLEVDAKSLLGIGVEIDKDYLGAGIIDFKGNILKKLEYNKDLTHFSPEYAASEVVSMVNNLLSYAQKDNRKVVGIGIGIPGLVDIDKGEMVFSAQLKWKKVKIRDIIQKEFESLTVTVDNEMKARALAESLYGMAKDSRRAALMSVGSGVGAALLINNKIYRGNSNNAGEIGHITIDPNGLLCECGRFGCLQTYIADWALMKEARKFRDISSLDELFNAYRENEQWARSIISRAIDYIGVAIGSLVCVYNPDTVILCGRVLKNYPETAKLVMERYKDFVWEPLQDTFKLEFSQLGEDAAIIGAGALAFVTGLDKYML
ncbi:MAG TPA: ROK family transcriptional regulator [Clostridiaceae bacterium]|nr:ROK family transcriptional regulator [Clostridiaceae bacterium]